MSAPRAKCVKKGGAAITPLEQRIAQEISTLETSHATLKHDLKPLYFSAAREVEIDSTRKAVLLFVPFPLIADFRKIQKTLVEELEKKLTGYHVLIIANRTMISPTSWSRNTLFQGVRPRSRTLKAVQEGLLDDIVYPTEITGKRIRVSVDGSKLLKVSLSKGDSNDKIDTYRAVWKQLTAKDVEFLQ